MSDLGSVCVRERENKREEERQVGGNSAYNNT